MSFRKSSTVKADPERMVQILLVQRYLWISVIAMIYGVR